MSNVGYDLDTSGGLMPLIRALIKPPDEDLNVPKPKKPQHPYYKRPGKGHNHDSCDACGEGGDLICCDRCPASFHLGCYDPPLDENDIPAGLWLCRECRASDDKPASTRSSRAQSPVDNKSDTDKKSRSLRNSRANSLVKKKGKEDGKEKEDEDGKETEPEKELSPMEILVKAAKVMNPKQFELPREMRIPCIFPGTEKEGKAGSGLVTVDAWGCVPLPAKSCFVCRGTCKMAPLLQCDYCPLLFHQDCLDPPLTALPTGRWMCPNHVEQYIDWKLVRSVSATERVALWERFSGPVDQHALKVDFIRRARNPRPSFRVKVPVGARGRVHVPRMVRHHYRRPPPLLPARRDHVRCRDVLKNLKAGGVYNSDDDEDDEAEDSDSKHQICMNLSCPQYSGDGECPLKAPRKPRPVKKELAETEEEPEGEKNSDSSEFSDSDFEHLTTTVKKRKVSQTENKSPGKRSSKADRLELCAEEGVEELLATVEEQLKKLDERLVKLLAWQRLPPPPGLELADALVKAALCEVLRPDDAGSASLGAAVAMRLSALSVGSDSACDVVLDARCRHVSPRHAVIFCDEVTRHFELINYSEWGSLVNGVMFACDVGRARPPAAPAAPAVPAAPAATAAPAAPALPAAPPDVALRHRLRRRDRPPRLNGSLTLPLEREAGCRCAGAAPATCGAWEGSALLAHGALLQFGCRLYVFSITDHETFPHLPALDEPAL